MGGFHKQVQSYTIFVLIISLGFINPFFFLGLLFNFSIISLMYFFDIPLKSVFLGIYCLISPFIFSILPFPRNSTDGQNKQPSLIPLRLSRGQQIPTRYQWLLFLWAQVVL